MSFTKNIVSVKDSSLEKKIQDRLNDLTKPPGSLGRLEEFAMKYCLVRGDEKAKLNAMQMFTFAGDHGITAEKVAPYPKEVTQQMVLNMVHGGAAISVLCKNAGMECSVVDMGVDAEFAATDGSIINRKVARGTKNFLRGPAMSKEECEQALKAGYELGKDCRADIVGIGEMGIGNTSSASAIYSLVLDKDVEKTVGAGTGAQGDLLLHKKKVIADAVKFHKKEWDTTGFDALRRVGGFEIAGMAGMIFGCAEKRVPVVADGFISCAAALIAMEMNPVVQEYLFFAHESSEKFHRDFLSTIEARPVLNLDMRLGEGSGGALAMQIIKQAMNCYHQMATFSGAGVSNKK